MLAHRWKLGHLTGLVMVLVLLSFQTSAQEMVTSSGVIERLEQGVLYLSGVPHSIVVVQTATGAVKVAASSASAVPMTTGEHVAFSGSEIQVRGTTVIDTTKGFFWRPDEVSMTQYVAAASKHAEEEAKKAGIPYNAVSVVSVQTAQQEATEREKERAAEHDKIINYTLAILTLIVGILAVERIPRLVAQPVSWMRSWTQKRLRAKVK